MFRERRSIHWRFLHGGPAVRGAGLLAISVLLVLCGQVNRVSGETPAHMIRVKIPITGNDDNRIKQAIERVLGSIEDGKVRPVLVLEFWPPQDEEEIAASDFERCASVARFLTRPRMNRVRTVAYLPRTIVGHAVLPVIACEEIIMHPDAELGAAGIGEESIPLSTRSLYREIASSKRTIPDAIALAMLDRSLTVYKVATPGGARFVLDENLEEIKKETAVTSIDTVVPQGDLARFTGQDLRMTLGFVSHLASDRSDLARELDLHAGALELDPSLGKDWSAIRVDLTGVINETNVNRVQRLIQDEIRKGTTNLVCLVIDSPGGSPAASLKLASFLADLDGSRVRTVAYISNEALADATLVAVGCDHVIMQSDAVLGGAGAYQPTDEEIVDLLAPIQKLCHDKAKRWSLPAAIMTPELEVHRYALKGTDIADYFCEAELEEQPDPGRWSKGEAVTTAEVAFQSNAERAVTLNLTRDTVENFEELKQLYSLETDPALVEPTWAHELIDYLAQPHVAATLLFFAGFALIAELTSPGIGLGGFLAAVCFVLFFWSQFFHGTATWLELMLFVTGVACVAIEIFVIPGFGVFGVGGGALIVASLVLASQTFVLPRNTYQMEQLPRSLLIVVAATGGVSVGLIVLRRFLEQAPLLRRVMLEPVKGEELAELQRREALGHLDHLLGQEGKTTTPLVPSGKARFGDEIVDVTSDGRAIDPGASIRVIEVRGNHVFVKPV